LLWKYIEREKNKRAQFYIVHGIKEELESQDRIEDKRARVYRKKANIPSTKDRTFLFIRALVLQIIKAKAQPAVKVEAQPVKVKV
jgi:hypothetical protein